MAYPFAQVPVPSSGSPPPLPADGAAQLTYDSELSAVRALVREQARAAGLSDGRAEDLVLAVSEVAANTLRHARSPGTLAVWHDQDEDEVVCQVHDKGIIAGPQPGRRKPGLDAPGGHGLWLVNQVCDRAELSSGPDGTTVRMHMALRTPAERD